MQKIINFLFFLLHFIIYRCTLILTKGVKYEHDAQGGKTDEKGIYSFLQKI